MINLGIEEDKKEVRVCSSLKESVNKELIELLWEYVDVFARPYQDMSWLNNDIVVHKIPLK